eukprot:766715-Hanusia_phi.AAC.10
MGGRTLKGWVDIGEKEGARPQSCCLNDWQMVRTPLSTPIRDVDTIRTHIRTHTRTTTDTRTRTPTLVHSVAAFTLCNSRADYYPYSYPSTVVSFY